MVARAGLERHMRSTSLPFTQPNTLVFEREKLSSRTG